jgi:hypothetical protein
MLNPTGDSPEVVALALLERVARSEGRHFDAKAADDMTPADRKWILDTYFECLNAAKGHRHHAEAAEDLDM